MPVESKAVGLLKTWVSSMSEIETECVAMREKSKTEKQEGRIIMLPLPPPVPVEPEPVSIKANIERLGSSKAAFAIVTRDGAIEHAVNPIIKYIADRELFNLADYLDIGCGTMYPASQFSEALGTLCQGIDFIERKTLSDEYPYCYETVDGSALTDKSIKYSDDTFMIITMCDILHHVPEPELLMETVIKKLCKGGYIILYDQDCQSWEDSYYLDVMHKAFVKTVGVTTNNYLPVYGYRSRSYWRDFMRERGFEVANSNDKTIEYRAYADCFLYIP